MKLRAYATAGVKECWLVLGPEQQVHVFSQAGGEHFNERAVHGPGGRLASAAVPEFSMDLGVLFTA